MSWPEPPIRVFAPMSHIKPAWCLVSSHLINAKLYLMSFLTAFSGGCNVSLCAQLFFSFCYTTNAVNKATWLLKGPNNCVICEVELYALHSGSANFCRYCFCCVWFVLMNIFLLLNFYPYEGAYSQLLATSNGSQTDALFLQNVVESRITYHDSKYWMLDITDLLKV